MQATTINVAINASNKALFTIMMSNNVSFHKLYFGKYCAGFPVPGDDFHWIFNSSLD